MWPKSPYVLGSFPPIKMAGKYDSIITIWHSLVWSKISMDSDSDSDGSHISATPPRDQPPPPPAAAAQLPRSTLLTSVKSRAKTRAAAATATSRPILKPKLSRKRREPAQNTNLEIPHQENLIIPPPDLSNLPFQIQCLTHQKFPFSSCNTSIGTLRPGSLCASKFASFSKLRKENLNFEDVASHPCESLLSSSKLKSNAICSDQVRVDTGDDLANFSKVSKKLPNLIGAFSAQPSSSSLLLPAKKIKRACEGNFVKLNINGHGRKRFTFRGNRRKSGNASSRSRRFTKRSKGKQKVGGEGEGEGKVESEEFCNEEGLILDQSSKRLDFDMGPIEEAVMRIRKEVSSENLLRLLKLTHGYDSFRDGQLEAIKMVLSGKSTMLVLPTGAGKSLCYQLPAILLPGITLVISPLVALMIDQLKQLPPAISGGLLSSSQTPEETSTTLKFLQDGTIKVLFVSPERLLNSEFTSLLSSSLLVSLVVVDEAHCVSEWSHNFRPSFMRLRASLLRAKLHAECIIAMTATATPKTLHDVMNALEIPDTNLIHVPKLRDNLQLSLSMNSNRMKELMALLKSSPFKEVKSIIIYCKFQSETDMISKYLRDNNIAAKSYHSAIPAKDRNRIQEMFCLNKIRVVVATVAFGMGLDKRDVGAVIHYSLPESLEEYVQEIGRAGRDGRLSYCHLFFDDATYFKMRSLTHSDGIDEYAVNKFLSQVFGNETNSLGEICSFVKEAASRKFDIKDEVMLTILTHLELGDMQYLSLLPPMNVTCTVNFHQTSPVLLATKDIVIAAILKKCEMKDGQYVFDIPRVANSIKVKASELLNHLQSLKFKGEITYELKDPALCYTIVNVPKDICSLTANVTKWLSEVEICKVRKIDAMYNVALYAVKKCNSRDGCHLDIHTSCIWRKISEYFDTDVDDDVHVPCRLGQNSPFLRADIKVFLQSNSQAKFTPRAIARIMHGLGSPAFPSATWSKTHFWGRYMHIDFKEIMEAAKAELMNFVVQGRS